MVKAVVDELSIPCLQVWGVVKAKQAQRHKSKPDGDAAKDERSVTDIQRSLDGTTASAAAYKKKHDGNDGPDRP